jgi:hypothetical protein
MQTLGSSFNYDEEGPFREDNLPFHFSGDRTPILRSGVSHIPLFFVWPDKIEPGQRFSDPVSMIDLLPTILDLVAHYTARLEAQWEAHRMLAEHYTAAEGSTLIPDPLDALEALEALGYVGD